MSLLEYAREQECRGRSPLAAAWGTAPGKTPLPGGSVTELFHLGRFSDPPILILASLAFIHDLRTGTLEPDAVRGTPLDMYQ